MTARSASIADRIVENVAINDAGCWVWQKSLQAAGYGNLAMNGTVLRAHRVSYEAFVGPIPADLVVDHLCRNRACVNPAHLEPVTHRVNLLRGTGFSARNAAATHCAAGHPFSAENTYRPPSRPGRRCRTCQRGWTANYKAKKAGLTS